MNALVMGLPFGADISTVRLYRSEHGHEARFLAVEGDADFHFDPRETAAQVVERVGRQWMPDVFVCWCPELYPPPLEIENCPVKTVALTSDWNIYQPQLEYNFSRYDVAVCDKLGAMTLKCYGIAPHYVMPLYAQQTPVHRKMNVEKDLDIVFAGNLNHNIHVDRGRCLERVAALSGRYRVALTYGVYGDDYARLLSRARIVVNHSVRREMNLRCFETLACGSLLFLEDSNIEAGEYLQNRQHVVYYNRDTLPELAEYYLTHRDEAERIAAQGHALAPALAGEARQDPLLDWIAAQPMGTRGFRRLSPRRQAVAEVLQYATSRVPAQAQLAQDLLGRALEAFPNDPELLSARGLACLEHATHGAPADRAAVVQESVRYLAAACNAAPEAAAYWLNLAFVSRRAQNAAAEQRCLELALDARACRGGGLLAGTVNEPYYALWRRALGLGTARIEMLWAMAACRRAELAFEESRHDEAAEWGRRAIAWMPEAISAYMVCADAELARGRPSAAVEILEQGTPHTSFDYGHRMKLIHALQRNGETDRACELADASARIFAACWGLEEHAEALRQLTATLA